MPGIPFGNVTRCALNVKTNWPGGKKWNCDVLQMTLRDCFPYVIYILSCVLSPHGLLPLRALIDDNHSNLLVVFPGLTLLWLEGYCHWPSVLETPLVIGHMARGRQISETERNDWGCIIFSVFSLRSAGDTRVTERTSWLGGFPTRGLKPEETRKWFALTSSFFLTPTCRWFSATRRGANYSQTQQHPTAMVLIVFSVALLFASRAAARLQLLLLIGNFLLIRVCVVPNAGRTSC